MEEKTWQEIPDTKQKLGNVDVKVNETKSKQLSEVEGKNIADAVKPWGEIKQCEPLSSNIFSNKEGAVVLKEGKTKGEALEVEEADEPGESEDKFGSKITGVVKRTWGQESSSSTEDTKEKLVSSEPKKENHKGDYVLHPSQSQSQEIKNEEESGSPMDMEGYLNPLSDTLWDYLWEWDPLRAVPMKNYPHEWRISRNEGSEVQHESPQLSRTETVISTIKMMWEIWIKMMWEISLWAYRHLLKDEQVETLPGNLSVQLKEDSDAAQMSSSKRVQVLHEEATQLSDTEVASSSAMPSKKMVKKINLEVERDSPFLVAVSSAGELSKYADLKFEFSHGVPSIKGQNETSEFKYCDFTSDADDYGILMRKKKVDQSNALEGDLSESKLPESSGNNLIMRQGGCELTTPPEEEKWRQASVIVLRDNALSSLPSEPLCPDLQLLFLQRNMLLRNIPDRFFSHMDRLRAADLSDNRMRSLPSSLFELANLQVLLLRNCKCLDELPKNIGQLRALEVLDLFGTELYKVPDEIKKLVHLRHLKLTFYGTDDESDQSFFLSPKIISGLKSLQALSIGVHPEDRRWIRNVEAIMEDLKELNSLSYLEFYFPKVQLFEQFTEKSEWENIKCFRFVVGQNVKRVVDRVSNDVETKFNEHSRCLRFVNGKEVQEAIKKVSKLVTALYLDHHLHMSSLSEMGITTSEEIKFCTIRECPSLEVIIEDDKELVQPAYPGLQHLGMHYLWELKSISRSQLVEGSFGSLKTLIVDTCPMLEFVLYESMVQSLSNLDELVVENCKQVKGIIRKSGDGMVNKEMAAFPQLSKLKLCHLPQLLGFWEKHEGSSEDPLPNGSFKALHSAAVWSCPKLDLTSLSSMNKDLKILDRESLAVLSKKKQEPQKTC